MKEIARYKFHETQKANHVEPENSACTPGPETVVQTIIIQWILDEGVGSYIRSAEAWHDAAICYQEEPDRKAMLAEADCQEILVYDPMAPRVRNSSEAISGDALIGTVSLTQSCVSNECTHNALTWDSLETATTLRAGLRSGGDHAKPDYLPMWNYLFGDD